MLISRGGLFFSLVVKLPPIRAGTAMISGKGQHPERGRYPQRTTATRGAPTADAQQDGQAKANRAAAEAAASSEKAAENIAQIEVNAAGARAPAACAAARAEVGIDAGMAELVVPAALILIGEHLVGLVDLLEFRLGVSVAGVEIGMILLRLLTVCFFYLVLSGIFADPEHLVKISFICQGKLLLYTYNVLLRDCNAIPQPNILFATNCNKNCFVAP